jgi:hypothetical protein
MGAKPDSSANIRRNVFNHRLYPKEKALFIETVVAENRGAQRHG